MCTLLMFIPHVSYKRTRKMNATELSSELRIVSCCLETYEYLFNKLTRPHCIKKLPSDHSGFFFICKYKTKSPTSRLYFCFFSQPFVLQILNQDELIQYAQASTARLSNKRIAGHGAKEQGSRDAGKPAAG